MGGKGRARVWAGSNLPLEYQSVLISPCPPKIAVGLEKGKKMNLKKLKINFKKFKIDVKNLKIDFKMKDSCLEDGGKADSGICCGGSELLGALMC